jgi:hypothetical protein
MSFFSDFNENLKFLDRYSEKAEISVFIKIRPVGAELFHADEQTYGHPEMMNLTVPYRNFMEAPKMRHSVSVLAHSLRVMVKHPHLTRHSVTTS